MTFNIIVGIILNKSEIDYINISESNHTINNCYVNFENNNTNNTQNTNHCIVSIKNFENLSNITTSAK